MTLLTTNEVAARIGCSRDTVSRVARENKIGNRVGRDWLFAPADCVRLEKLIRPGPGSPAFCAGNQLWKKRKKRRKPAKK